MRKGILLEESPPKVLLEKYNMKSLEDVFLLLSSKQQHDRIEQRRKSIGVEAHRRQSVLLVSCLCLYKYQRTVDRGFTTMYEVF